MTPFIHISALAILVHFTIAQNWNYDTLGPEVWSDLFHECGRTSQSPINIRTSCTVYQSYDPFQFSPSYREVFNFTLVNDGTTIDAIPKANGSSPFQLIGGGLNGTFDLIDFHLHWGENHRSGSEHQVNGEQYAGEIHLVHRNPQTKKLAVLGIFMKSFQNQSTNATMLYNTDPSTITEWTNYISAAQQLRQMNDSVAFNLNVSALMGNELYKFWRYEGSLTVPPCTEGVIWTVFTRPIVFDEGSINLIRQNLLPVNYRYPEPLFNRRVYRNFLNDTVSSIPDYTCSAHYGNNVLRGFQLLFLPFFSSFCVVFRALLYS